MSKKIVVPEGILSAVITAIGKKRLERFDHLAQRDGELWPAETIQITLETALNWLSDELESMLKDDPYLSDHYRSESLNENAVRTGFNNAIRTVRSIFVAPEPEAPEQVKDLLCAVTHTDEESYFRPDIYNQRIIEAFNRGRGGARSK